MVRTLAGFHELSPWDTARKRTSTACRRDAMAREDAAIVNVANTIDQTDGRECSCKEQCKVVFGRLSSTGAAFSCSHIYIDLVI